MWYDPIIILFALAGLVIIFTAHHNKHAFHWGLVIFFLALITKAFLWFESLL
jgi:hypothetical protein